MSGGKLILVVGGARSGKSRYALKRGEEEAGKGRKFFVATAVPCDEEMRARIEEHKRMRPPDWEVVEEPWEPWKAGKLGGKGSVFVVDCLTLWLFNWFERLREGRGPRELREALERKGGELAHGLRSVADGGAKVIAVTNEVGMGVIPPDPYDRAFGDALGRVNQMVAEVADEVVWVCCGMPLRIKPASRS